MGPLRRNAPRQATALPGSTPRWPEMDSSWENLAEQLTTEDVSAKCAGQTAGGEWQQVWASP
jgi:hypothetical protein